MKIERNGDSGVILVKINQTQTPYGTIESIHISGVNGMEFCVEPCRGLDISSLSFNGTAISYLAPCGVQNPSVFDYSNDSFSNNMFFGLLTTCGLENTGPGCKDEHGIQYSQHGSLDYCEAENVRFHFEENGRVLTITGIVQDTRFSRHHFVLNRKIQFSCETSEIAIEDSVENQGEKDQICIMYHYNFGDPFLSDCCQLEIPFSSATPKNADAIHELDNITTVTQPSSLQKPHVFYLQFSPAALHSASIYNPKLDIFAKLSFAGDSLPCMDLWKNLRPDQYVMSFEPCNAFPYGRTNQVKKGNACYLEKNETKIYTTIFKVGRKNEQA